MTGIDPAVWVGPEIGHSDEMLWTVHDILKRSKMIGGEED